MKNKHKNGVFGILFFIFGLISCNPNNITRCPILIGNVNINGWRVEKVSDQPEQLLNFEFLDSMVGFGVISFSQIARTTDGGKSWQVISNNLPNFNPSFSFCARDTGFVAASIFLTKDPQFFFKKTTDGGQNFQAIGDTIIGNVRNLHFFDSRNGYLTGQLLDDGNLIFSQQVWKTTDGAATWVRDSYFDKDEFCISMQWISPKVGIIIMGNGRIYRTTNGGAQWYLMNSPNVTQYQGFGYDFVNENLGFVINQNGSGADFFFGVNQTTDGGKTWRPMSDKFNITAVLAAENDQKGLYIGKSTECDLASSVGFFATEDGGANWEESLSLQQISGWERVRCRDPKVFFARVGFSQLLKITKK